MTLKRTDELNAIANHASQICEELKFIDEDFRYVEGFVLHLRILAKDFRPLPESRDLLRLNPNVKPDDPRAELEVFERKMRDTIENLDRAAELLRQRRAAIEKLLT